MHSRHLKKVYRRLLRTGFVLVLVLALCVSSFATVMANTVSANVIDGEKSYSFSMNTTDLSAILEQAEKEGMAPLGELDTAERVQNTTTVYIRRGVELTLHEAGWETSLVAYRGETIEEALRRNNILLTQSDEISPKADTVIEESTTVDLTRTCTVTVVADGKSHQVSLTGATVGQALRKAGVEVGEGDSLNYEKNEPLFDKMTIRVVRRTNISVTVDGKTQEYAVSAQSVGEALEKCGIVLGEDDRLSCKAEDKLTEGMEIVVSRVVKEKASVEEEIPFETVYEDTDSLAAGETSVKTEGVPGKKEVTYEVVYVDGKEESRTPVEEKVLEEAQNEVVLRGTREDSSSPAPAPDTGSGSGSTGSGKTFVDHNGNVVEYTSMLTGNCTAYSVPGGTTSLGWDAVYGIVAVNPNIIPYGTRLYITSPDGSVVYGYGIAGDTGGAVMSGEIIADLCYNTIEECSIIGRRPMNVYILP